MAGPPAFRSQVRELPSLDSNQPDLFGDCLPDNAAELEKAREAAVQTITKETVENKKRGTKQPQDNGRYSRT